ncbi:MAG: hypothetical protein ACRDLB_03790 [Actinomycetota bacterium]
MAPGHKRLEDASEEDWRSLLGRKVSIRFRRNEPEHPFSEAIGVVMSVKPDESGRPCVTIVNRRGALSEVPLADVMAGKAWVDQ